MSLSYWPIYGYGISDASAEKIFDIRKIYMTGEKTHLIILSLYTICGRLQQRMQHSFAMIVTGRSPVPGHPNLKDMMTPI